jgi:hypothetical protein
MDVDRRTEWVGLATFFTALAGISWALPIFVGAQVGLCALFVVLAACIFASLLTGHPFRSLQAQPENESDERPPGDPTELGQHLRLVTALLDEGVTLLDNFQVSELNNPVSDNSHALVAWLQYSYENINDALGPTEAVLMRSWEPDRPFLSPSVVMPEHQSTYRYAQNRVTWLREKVQELRGQDAR